MLSSSPCRRLSRVQWRACTGSPSGPEKFCWTSGALDLAVSLYFAPMQERIDPSALSLPAQEHTRSLAWSYSGNCQPVSTFSSGLEGAHSQPPISHSAHSTCHSIHPKFNKVQSYLFTDTDNVYRYLFTDADTEQVTWAGKETWNKLSFFSLILAIRFLDLPSWYLKSQHFGWCFFPGQ